jgi:hypothetical protein
MRMSFSPVWACVIGLSIFLLTKLAAIGVGQLGLFDAKLWNLYGFKTMLLLVSVVLIFTSVAAQQGRSLAEYWRTQERGRNQEGHSCRLRSRDPHGCARPPFGSGSSWIRHGAPHGTIPGRLHPCPARSVAVVFVHRRGLCPRPDPILDGRPYRARDSDPAAVRQHAGTGQRSPVRGLSPDNPVRWMRPADNPESVRDDGRRGDPMCVVARTHSKHSPRDRLPCFSQHRQHGRRNHRDAPEIGDVGLNTGALSASTADKRSNSVPDSDICSFTWVPGSQFRSCGNGWDHGGPFPW